MQSNQPTIPTPPQQQLPQQQSQQQWPQPQQQQQTQPQQQLPQQQQQLSQPQQQLPQQQSQQQWPQPQQQLPQQQSQQQWPQPQQQQTQQQPHLQQQQQHIPSQQIGQPTPPSSTISSGTPMGHGTGLQQDEIPVHHTSSRHLQPQQVSQQKPQEQQLGRTETQKPSQIGSPQQVSSSQQQLKCPLGYGSDSLSLKNASIQFGRIPGLSEQSSINKDQIITRDNGCPIGHVKDSLTAGSQGPLCVLDLDLLEKLQHFNCEKIPPRNVHALGSGAYGTFTLTNDISQYTSADLFNDVGKTTQFITRFSGIFTEVGDPETTRDPRGFALKFYTKEGNWDLLGINTPVFALRDAKLGPDAVHAFKRDPRTGCWNITQTWDYVANHPEGLHQMAMLFTDRIGTPMSYRTMNAYGCHTFSMVNAQKQRFWVKYHIISQQGAHGFNQHEAKLVAGEDPNFLSRDLYQALEKKQFPTWKLMMQVMPEDEGYKHAWTFDATKIWKHSEYPMIEIGVLEVNRNVSDYFTEVEQVAFSPANIVPGLGLSPDKLLQGRLLIYDSTQIHRIGPNYKQLFVNRPHGLEAQNHNLGGNMQIQIKDAFPHYIGSVFGGLKPNSKYIDPPFKVTGLCGLYEVQNEGSYQDYYEQVADFWKVLSDKDKNSLCDNLAASFFRVTEPKVVDMMMQHFTQCDQQWAQMIQTKLRERKEGKWISEGEKVCMNYSQQLATLTRKEAL